MAVMPGEREVSWRAAEVAWRRMGVRGADNAAGIDDLT
jgi:hypothetical protein